MSECLVCGRPEPPEPLYAGLVRCPSCGMVWADLTVTDDEVRRLYDRNYFFDGEYVDYLADRGPLQRSFRRQLRTLRRFVPQGGLYEIGCAYGFFLELAREVYEPVAGIDISPEAVAYARQESGLDVACGEFLEADIEPGQYDCFACWATLEHLTRPAEYVARVAELLPPGGHFALSTCDIDSLNARLAGPRWRVIHPPTHLHYWSRRTLRRLLERHGLEVVFGRYVGSYRSVDQVFHALLARRRRGWYESLAKLSLARWSFYFNSCDAVYLIARKQGAA